MDRKELLTMVRDKAGLQSLQQADKAVRAIVGVLKTMLSHDVAEEIEESLPQDLREGWRVVEPFPADILEREDIYFEGVVEEEPGQHPTITHG
ncbi:MAG: DUF2267 domain-containing protein [Actinobacteria bacterium]|jgi:uncharacterized protein (DUF2267 family)|nr:MAG: DUF2267 domain-containing protein [Actinomycetota bacterium]